MPKDVQDVEYYSPDIFFNSLTKIEILENFRIKVPYDLQNSMEVIWSFNGNLYFISVNYVGK